jgi:L-ascorbate metabolism protein UlaG (beta-lactamase superfamily)
VAQRERSAACLDMLMRNAPSTPSPSRLRRALWMLAALGGVTALLLTQLPSWGSLPEGQRLKQLEASPNLRDGEFQYPEPTPLFVDEKSTFERLKDALFKTQPRLRPAQALPVVKTDLAALDPAQDVAVWLGHSSTFLQVGGQRILMDPVFSAYAGPLPFVNQAFEGDYPYSAANMPVIDVLFISHDHYDHLDHPTVVALKDKVKRVVVPLGVGAHLVRWGYDPRVIDELDWNQWVEAAPGLVVRALPARHFSGRGLRGNRSLFASVLFETAQRKVFYSGDSGYGPHFADIGRRFGPIDLALVENGQYDPSWTLVHMAPEQAVQATIDLQAKAVIPVHAGRFAMANHAWDDPFKRFSAASRGQPFRLLTPRMGEPATIADHEQVLERWWEPAAR